MPWDGTLLFKGRASAKDSLVAQSHVIPSRTSNELRRLLTAFVWPSALASQVPFVMDQPGWSDTGTFTAAEEKLASTMGVLWAAFARTRMPQLPRTDDGGVNPAASRAWSWPPYLNHSVFDDAGREAVFDTAPTLSAEPHHRARYCDFWTNYSAGFN